MHCNTTVQMAIIVISGEKFIQSLPQATKCIFSRMIFLDYFPFKINDRAYIVGLRKIACKFSNSRQRNSSRVSFSQIFVQKSALRCRVHFHLIIRRKQKEQEMKIWKSNGEMKIPSYNIPGKNPINQG